MRRYSLSGRSPGLEKSLSAELELQNSPFPGGALWSCGLRLYISELLMCIKSSALHEGAAGRRGGGSGWNTGGYGTREGLILTPRPHCPARTSLEVRDYRLDCSGRTLTMREQIALSALRWSCDGGKERDGEHAVLKK